MGKQSKKKGNFLTSAHQALQRKGVVTTVYLVLRLLVILVMVAQFFNRNFENVFLCILTLVLLLLPTVLERRLQIDLPNTLEIIIMLFIFAAEILGEIQAYYTASPTGTPCSTLSTASSAPPSASPWWICATATSGSLCPSLRCTWPSWPSASP